MSSKHKRVYVNAIKLYQPPPTAPDWVRANGRIDIDGLTKIDPKYRDEKDLVPVNLLRGRGGGLYFVVDEWRLANPRQAKPPEESSEVPF